MPIRYERVDDPPRITLTAEGQFSAEEVIDALDRMRREGTWSYPVLCDIRLLTGLPDMTELRRLADVARRPGLTDERRGRVAFVAVDPALYGLACAYAGFAGPGRADVFADPAEADLWLMRHEGLA